ncbi:uncharacterized protein LOC124262650 [Haliotis rubra]|uniref:uncharacterized protein LOC124262650 n=1 Tax=Haliotis rubra TaxID=36100 RepID=UPI001EE52A9E|nr:uncharacterized protein LOC124262650 [Haliotis rubra]
MIGTMGLLYLLVLFSLVSGNDGTLNVTALYRQVNCTDPQSMLVASQKCLDAYNIPLKVASIQELVNSSDASYISNVITPAYLADMCRNPDTYQKARVRVNNILSKCINQTQMLPSELNKKWQDNLCANLGKFNITCMFEMTSKLADCSSTFSYLTTSDYINLNITDIDHKTTCMSEKLSSVCIPF